MMYAWLYLKTLLFQLPSSPGAAGDCSSLGRERVKQFTYDQSYWSVNSGDPHYTTQEQVSAVCAAFQHIPRELSSGCV